MRPRALLLLGVIVLAVAMGVLSAGPYWEMSEALDGTGMFDEAPAAGVRDVEDRLDSLGPDAKAKLARHIRFDVPFFILHALGLGLIVLAAVRYARAPGWALGLLLAPLVGAVLGDAVEDWQLHAIATSDEVKDRTAQLMGQATRIKLGFLMGVAGSLGGALVLAVVQRLKED